MTTPKAIVTRFAPSPTGRLHVGGARTALFCWALARQANLSNPGSGAFILRIEDTDRLRSSDASTRRILDDLAWLGITWDEGPELRTSSGFAGGGDPRGVGPFEQSARFEMGEYDKVVNTLLDSGRAYHAFETPEELAAMRDAAMKAKWQFRYDRSALSIPEAERRRRAESGEPHVVRFLMADEAIEFDDEIRGHVTIQPSELDDFVIRKADGWPTYHLAVVADDEAMGVTHVIRGEEHLANTPRHVALQKALGYRIPTFAHLSLIFNPDGSKMSKRDRDKAARQACESAGLGSSPVEILPESDFERWMKDKRQALAPDQLEAIADKLDIELPEIDVCDFEAAGFLPETLCNFLSLLGWSPGDDIEKFDNEFLAQRIALGRMVKTAAKFDRKKLLSFNTDSITAMSDGEFHRRWRTWCELHDHAVLKRLDAGQVELLAAALRPRCKTLREAAVSARFALVGAEAIRFDEKAVQKTLLKDDGEGLGVLRGIRGRIEAMTEFTCDAINELVKAYSESAGVGMGKVAQPLRVALTGSTVSPPIDATLAVLGKVQVLTRIDRCLKECAVQAS
ncbi:MAG: glutamate--tRNA ligase [Phycisphaeraceae bacterium]|nr:glutamate--tRNA ligase [Phycisphaeraceae bacterium]